MMVFRFEAHSENNYIFNNLGNFRPSIVLFSLKIATVTISYKIVQTKKFLQKGVLYETFHFSIFWRIFFTKLPTVSYFRCLFGMRIPVNLENIWKHF